MRVASRKGGDTSKKVVKIHPATRAWYFPWITIKIITRTSSRTIILTRAILLPTFELLSTVSFTFSIIITIVHASAQFDTVRVYT